MKCKILECQKESLCRELCSKHYTKLQRYGDPLHKKQHKMFERCQAEGCERHQKSKGYCSTHYIKIRRTGTLQRLVFLKEWAEKNGKARHTAVSRLDNTPDPNGRGTLANNTVSSIRYKARKRGIEWTLSDVATFFLIKSACNYCGFQPNWPETRVGIDRVDNCIGYNEDNCVPCCTTCNSAKGQMTLDEFIVWIKRVADKLSKL